MDYIPSPGLPRHAHALIPLLCSVEFKFSFDPSLSYNQYPLSRGFSFGSSLALLDLDTELRNTSTTDRLFGLFQEWLMFGLLSEFLKRTVEAKEFVASGDNPDVSTRLITMASLPGILTDYLNNAASKWTEASWLIHCRRMDQVFTYVRYVIEIVDARSRDTGDEKLMAFSLAVTCLGVALEVVYLKAHQNLRQTYNDLERLRPLGNWSQPHFITRRLKQDRWCPNLVLAMELHLTPLEAYYASLLSQSSKLHSNRHQNCTKDDCVASDIDERVYKQRHLRDVCACDSISVNSEEVGYILRAGGVPILETSQDSDGVITVEPVDASKRRVFVAVSREYHSAWLVLGSRESNGD